MKKQIFLAAILCSAFAASAQDVECTICPVVMPSKTASNFNARFIRHRHIVSLQHGNKMMVEMYDIRDYDILKNSTELFTEFLKNIEPIKDSLRTGPSEHVRIDYAYNSDQQFRKIRIKKYASNGAIFLQRNGELSSLKVEQDTIRILIEKMKVLPVKNHPEGYKLYRPVQVTFVLNNYTDLERIINTGELQQYIDTMAATTIPAKKTHGHYKTTLLYYPYARSSDPYWGNNKFMLYRGLLSDESMRTNAKEAPKRWGLNVDIGAGLIGSKICPTADVGIEYRFLTWGGDDYIRMLRFTLSPYFIFEKNTANKIGVYDNWFINAEFGALGNIDENFPLTKAGLGIGYLLRGNGSYLSDNTMKIFISAPVTEKSEFVICPELIFTNNFHTLFPGITFKGFLNRD